MTDVKKSLDVALGEIFNSLLSKVHTCIPGQIVSFNAAKQTISAQPVLKRKYKENGEVSQLPVIEDIPVIFPGSGDFWLTFELKKDDYVLLLFSERAIESWLTQGGIVDPKRTRKFSLSDGIAIAGINPLTNILVPPVESGIALRNKINTVNVKVTSTKIEANVLTNKFEITPTKSVGSLFVTQIHPPPIPPAPPTTEVVLATHTHPAPGSPPTPTPIIP